MNNQDVLEKVMLFFWGMYEPISESWYIPTVQVDVQRKTRDVVQKLMEKGVSFLPTTSVTGSYDAMMIVVPNNRTLGIRMWGYIDYLCVHPTNRRVVYRIDNTSMPAFSPNPRTRRVDSIKEKLEAKKVLAAKRPYKYSLAR